MQLTNQGQVGIKSLLKHQYREFKYLCLSMIGWNYLIYFIFGPSGGSVLNQKHNKLIKKLLSGHDLLTTFLHDLHIQEQKSYENYRDTPHVPVIIGTRKFPGK